MKTKHTKKIFPLLFAILMAIVIIPFSSITAFADAESITVTSIEIEALRPADGVEAKIDAIRIKSVNGDTSLANQVSFMSNRLFWAEVPNLDPSTWGSNWSTFTGTFEEGKIYSLHFALQSAQPVASSCTVTLYEPNGNPWWQDDIASDDATYVVGDAVHEIAREIRSIVVEMPGSMVPTVGGTPINTFTVKSVNGDESLVDVLDHFECGWYYNTEYYEDIYYNNYYYRPEFVAGYSYESYFYMESANENDVFAEDCVLTVKTPSGDITIPIYSEGGNDWADFSKRYPVLEGDGLKQVGDIAITLNGYEQGKPAADVTLDVMQENFTIDTTSIKIYDDCDIVEAGEFQYQTYYDVYFNLIANDGYSFMVKDGRFRNITVNGIRANVDGPYYDDDGDYEYVDVYVELPILFESAAKPGKIELELDGYEIGGVAEDVEITGKHDGFDLYVEPGEYNDSFWFEGADRSIDYEEAFEKDGKYLLVLYMYPNKVLDLGGMQNEDFTLNGIAASNYRISTDYDESDVGYNESIRLEFELPTLHLAGETWEYDENDHWNECDCTERVNLSSHEDGDNDGKCDICTYKMYDIQYIHDGFDLILEGYEIGNPTNASIDGTHIDTPEDAHYSVFSHKVFKYDAASDDWVVCTDSDVFEAGARYMVDVTLRAEPGYELYPFKVFGEIYDVTLNGIYGIKHTFGFIGYRFYLPPLVESGEKCPEDEVVLNGYVEGKVAGDLSLGLPDGYTSGAYNVGFVLEGIESDEVLDNTGSHRLICMISPPANYDLNTFSKETLTVFGCEPDIVMITPDPSAVVLYLVYTLPDAPKTSDVAIDKIELTLNGYEIGASTDDVWCSPKESAEYVSEFSQFVLGADSYDEYIGNIVAGQKYYYMISIKAKSGYTLTSLRHEDVTLNGKAAVYSFYEDGIFLCLIYELDAPDSTDTPGGTTPGGTDTPDDPDKKDGLGAGAIVAIVISSVAVAGIGGFAIFWFVIRKKSLADLGTAFKALFEKIKNIFDNREV